MKSSERNPNDGKNDIKCCDKEHQQTLTTKTPTKSEIITMTKMISSINLSKPKRNYNDFRGDKGLHKNNKDEPSTTGASKIRKG